MLEFLERNRKETDVCIIKKYDVKNEERNV